MARYEELKSLLESRRQELMAEVRSKMKNVRAQNHQEQGVLDMVETTESDIQDDIEFALIQMKTTTLKKIEDALKRLDEGTYGNCFECGDEISSMRLRGLPFAVRCKDCEEKREVAIQREKTLAQRRSAAGFMIDLN